MSLEEDSPPARREGEGRHRSPRPPLPPVPPRSSTLSSSISTSSRTTTLSFVSPDTDLSSPAAESVVDDFARRSLPLRELSASTSSHSHSSRLSTTSSSTSSTAPSTALTSAEGGSTSSTSSLLPPTFPQPPPTTMPYPPPPLSLPTSYSHPSLPPPTPARRPLPALPAGGTRFVPLHPLPPLSMPTPRGGKGKQRASTPPPPVEDPEVEAKRAYVRERGLDELDSPGGAAGGGRGGGEAESPYSPASSELPPQYAEGPLLQQRESMGKRSMGLDEAAAAVGEEKTSLALADVRERTNEEARRQVEADQGESKAWFSRRRREEEEEEEERRRREVGRAEVEARKRLEVVRIREDEERREREEERERERRRLEREREEDDAPPPLSPTSMGMFPLVGEKQRPHVTILRDEKVAPPPPPSSTSLLPIPNSPATQPYRLPPPPVPTSTDFLPSTYAPAVPVPPSQPDYFSRYPPPSTRPSLLTSHTAPVPSSSSSSSSSTLVPPPPLPPTRPETTRHASLEPSRSDSFYSGGISPYGASGRYVPTPAPRVTDLAAVEGGTAAAVGRHGSLGPPAAFYGAGVGLAIGKDAGSLAPPLSRGSSSSPTSPVAPIFEEPSAEPDHGASSSGTGGRPAFVRHRQSMSWSQPSPSLPLPASFAPALAARPATGVTSTTSQFGILSQPYPSPSLVQTHPYHHQPQRQNSSFLPPPPSATTAIAAAPAFYTSLTPGGPLLPFYPSPSIDGGAPTSFFSPTGTAPPSSSGFLPFPPPPPPPQPQRYASLSPPPSSTSPLSGPLPPPPAQRSSSATDLRPWSRSSSASPNQAHLLHQPAAAGERPGRTNRMSTIRNLFGRKGGGGKGAGSGAGSGGVEGGMEGLPGTPEEEVVGH